MEIFVEAPEITKASLMYCITYLTVGTQIMFRIYGFICLLVLVLFYAVNRILKVEGFKYQANDFDEDAPHALGKNMVRVSKILYQISDLLFSPAWYSYGRTVLH